MNLINRIGPKEVANKTSTALPPVFMAGTFAEFIVEKENQTVWFYRPVKVLSQDGLISDPFTRNENRRHSLKQVRDGFRLSR
jgi:hypothetical protein